MYSTRVFHQQPPSQENQNWNIHDQTCGMVVLGLPSTLPLQSGHHAASPSLFQPHQTDRENEWFIYSKRCPRTHRWIFVVEHGFAENHIIRSHSESKVGDRLVTRSVRQGLPTKFPRIMSEPGSATVAAGLLWQADMPCETQKISRGRNYNFNPPTPCSCTTENRT